MQIDRRKIGSGKLLPHTIAHKQVRFGNVDDDMHTYTYTCTCMMACL